MSREEESVDPQNNVKDIDVYFCLMTTERQRGEKKNLRRERKGQNKVLQWSYTVNRERRIVDI